jgi:4-methyl-5(b-hydroxyethyl)-thiazole monophosphate biosynthesis
MKNGFVFVSRVIRRSRPNAHFAFVLITAPAVALVPNGLLGDEPATCYPAPAFRNTLKEVGSSVSDEAVVVSGNLVTSQGPGTSLLFALQLGEELFGKEKRDEIAKQMLVA